MTGHKSRAAHQCCQLAACTAVWSCSCQRAICSMLLSMYQVCRKEKKGPHLLASVFEKPNSKPSCLSVKATSLTKFYPTTKCISGVCQMLVMQPNARPPSPPPLNLPSSPHLVQHSSDHPQMVTWHAPLGAASLMPHRFSLACRSSICDKWK